MESFLPLTFDDLHDSLENVVDDSDSQFHAACPICEADDICGHHLYVKNTGDDTPPLLFCHRCNSPYEELLQALEDGGYESSTSNPVHNNVRSSWGRKKRYRLGRHGEREVVYENKHFPLVENYDHVYKNPDGTTAYCKKRQKDINGHKEFRFYYKDENGEIQWKQPDGAPVLYNLDAMEQASPLTTLYIVEGEKCADAMMAHSLLATTSNSGARDSVKLTAIDIAMLSKFTRKVVIPDNDDKGESYVKAWECVKVLRLSSIWPECPHKGDVADYFAANLPVEAIVNYDFDNNVGSTLETIPTHEMLSNAVEEYQGGLTNFTDQPLQLRCGRYDAGGNNVTINIIKGKMIENIVVSPVPVMVTASLENVDTGQEYLQISFFKNDCWRSFTTDRGTVASKTKIIELANIGLEVTSSNAKYLVDYISFLVNANRDIIPRIPIYNHLGWTDDKKNFIPFDEGFNINTGPDSRENLGLVSAFTASGSYDEWKDRMRSERTNIYLRLVMDVAFAAPLIGLINCLSFILFLWGGTEKGKTLASMCAASIWGNPAKGKLMTSLNTTLNAMLSTACVLHSLPFFGNELQTLKNNMMRYNRGGITYDQIIYALCEGIDRRRCDISGVAKTAGTWDLTFILNGEEPIIKSTSDAGAVNRVIEIECEKELINNVDSVGPELAKFILDNFGYAGPDFIGIIKSQSDLLEQYTAIRKSISEATGATAKQVMAISAVLLADKLAAMHIFNEEVLTMDQIAPFVKSKISVSDSERAWDFIVCTIEQHRNNFDGCVNGLDGNINARGEVWGHWSLNTNIVEINKKVLENELSKGGFDFKALKNDWLVAGHLDKPKSGWGRQTTIASEGAYLIKLRL